MHTAKQLHVSMFSVEIDGRVSDRDALLPGWNLHDRLGVIVHEPFGGVGASLLVQIAITAFYDVLPSRRGGAPVYPEIYLFHVGGSYGNHGYFDCWPPRKEVFVENDAGAVLSAVNDRAITRLLVVDGEPLAALHNPWERSAAEERIRSAFAYSADGRVANADVSVSGMDPQTEANAAMTLHPDQALTKILSSRDLAPSDSDRYDPLAIDRQLFAALVMARVNEVGLDELRCAASGRAQVLKNGVATETYRRVTVREALELLAKPQQAVSTGQAPQLQASNR